MRKTLALAALVIAGAAHAESTAAGPDFSGTYDCKGRDKSEGPYKGTVTLALVRAQSSGPFSAYNFKLEVPGYGAYPGEAAAHGFDMAIHFANVDPKTQDYGTGIARFKRGLNGKWTFHKFYYEPQYKGGNYGREDCVQR